MSLQVQPECCSEKVTTKDQEEDQKSNIINLVSTPITPNEDEGSQYQEGGIRGWATLIGV